jgi:hypothetical protein
MDKIEQAKATQTEIKKFLEQSYLFEDEDIGGLAQYLTLILSVSDRSMFCPSHAIMGQWESLLLDTVVYAAFVKEFGRVDKESGRPYNDFSVAWDTYSLALAVFDDEDPAWTGVSKKRSASVLVNWMILDTESENQDVLDLSFEELRFKDMEALARAKDCPKKTKLLESVAGMLEAENKKRDSVTSAANTTNIVENKRHITFVVDVHGEDGTTEMTVPLSSTFKEAVSVLAKPPSWKFMYRNKWLLDECAISDYGFTDGTSLRLKYGLGPEPCHSPSFLSTFLLRLPTGVEREICTMRDLSLRELCFECGYMSGATHEIRGTYNPDTMIKDTGIKHGDIVDMTAINGYHATITAVTLSVNYARTKRKTRSDTKSSIKRTRFNDDKMTTSSSSNGVGIKKPRRQVCCLPPTCDDCGLVCNDTKIHKCANVPRRQICWRPPTCDDCGLVCNDTKTHKCTKVPLDKITIDFCDDCNLPSDAYNVSHSKCNQNKKLDLCNICGLTTDEGTTHQSCVEFKANATGDGFKFGTTSKPSFKFGTTSKPSSKKSLDDDKKPDGVCDICEMSLETVNHDFCVKSVMPSVCHPDKMSVFESRKGNGKR